VSAAVYPGSFNPWHQGHTDILLKALRVFDHVYIVPMVNPDKPHFQDTRATISEGLKAVAPVLKKRVTVERDWFGLLKDYVEVMPQISGVIRGLRNGTDLQYEQNLQYWNEDLGLKIPFIYFVCDRTLGHISSSAVRAIKRFQTNK
jgi:pantetheine-phosphate adenylyltransferase